MIDLLGSDNRSLFGIITALEVEGIPYRRIARAEDFGASALVVAGRSLSPDILALADRVPSVIVAPPSNLTGTAHGRAEFRGTEGERAVHVSLAEAIWPERVRRIAQQFGIAALRIPWTRIWRPEHPLADVVLASYSEAGGPPGPAIVGRDVGADRSAATPLYWSLVDFGEALTNLLDERYLCGGETTGSATPRVHRRLPRPVLALYYRAPERLRAFLQRRTYARLCRRLAHAGDRSSSYPVDPTGWLLIEVITALVRAAAGPLVRLARWPTPYVAAAAITHDLEPSRFAYSQGLDRLLSRLAHTGQPATVGVVARPAARHLTHSLTRRLRRHEIMCHGLEHRGETLVGSPDQIARHVADTRRRLEQDIGCRIRGFRSPRLDRSPALLLALDRAGFAYDSSYPDVDRENLTHFGGGVRLNVPFRPPVNEEPQTLRASRCLEIPVSAPDCIQPLFFGGPRRVALRSLATAVTDKIAFIDATEGLYVGIVHAGVFGRRDAARRGAHLGFVRRRLRYAGMWLTSTGAVAEWWHAREGLRMRVENEMLEVTNYGHAPVSGARVVFETRDGSSTVRDLPTLQPNERTIVEITQDILRRAPWGVRTAADRGGA